MVHVRGFRAWPCDRACMASAKASMADMRSTTSLGRGAPVQDVGIDYIHIVNSITYTLDTTCTIGAAVLLIESETALTAGSDRCCAALCSCRCGVDRAIVHE